jgi:class 3 adenylate cyclase/tetratricopeptide (TPR) repeat protein
VVSVLFCDLAGFTERSDRADPEDVRRVLVPFHAAAKREIERYGGHLDKFLGDGALGVFGAPVAHEDDPLRAVEAGLAILREVERLARSQPGSTLQARAGVATGTAVVQLGAGPQVGEAVAGDVVNTASRLQGVAEPGTLVVDASVHPAIATRVDAAPLGEVTVKGKREPLHVWRVDAVRPAGPGVGSAIDEPPFTGRSVELRALRDAWEDVAGGGPSRVLLLTGEAGIGKTRLLAEAAAASGGRWLRGRCHPYGEGVTFAALAHVVREGLGLHADAAGDTVARRVHDLAAAIDPDPGETAWLARHVGALLGVRDDAGGAPRADEAPVAWGRAIAGIAGDEPLAIVVDDTHWADPALVEVVEGLPALAGAVALLIVAVGRPEMADRWRRPTQDDLALGPLDPVEVATLIRAVAPGAVTELHRARIGSVVDAAGGNPLYAVEYGRLLAEHPDTAVGVPGSIQGLVSARLDVLPPDERTALQDASVMGRSFWGAALPAIGGGTDPVTLEPVLASLARRGLIRAEGDDTFAFAQTLVREIAYGRLTRTQRLRSHRAAADWLAERRDTLAGAVDGEAHHRRMALELARTLDSPDQDEIAAQARAAFRTASDHAYQFDLPRSVALAREALALTPEDDPELPALLVATTAAARRAGQIAPGDAASEYERAVATARRIGNRAIEAEALTRAAMDLGFDGATERGRQTLDEALVLLENLPPSLTTVRAMLTRAEELDFAGRYDEVSPWLERAASILADTPGSGLMRPDDERLDPAAVELANFLLHLRGDVRCVGGDLDGGIADIRRTIDLARAVGNANSELQALSYLAEWAGMIEGPAAALGYQERALRLCEKRGFARSAWWTRAERGWALADLERWDEVAATTERILEEGEETTGDTTHAVARWLQLRLLAAEGRLEEAAGLADEVLRRARDVEQIQLLVPVLSAVAVVRAGTDRPLDATTLVREAIELTRDDGQIYRMLLAPDLVRASLSAGDRPLAEEVVDGLTSSIPRPAASLATARALLAGPPNALASWRDALAAWEPMGTTVETRLAAETVARLEQEGASDR